MASSSYQNQQIKLNKKGFLVDCDNWDREVCKALAAADGLELNEPRWQVIRFARAFYKVMGVSPSPHVLIRNIGDRFAHANCTCPNIGLLFPDGGCRQVCRLAGLPEYVKSAC